MLVPCVSANLEGGRRPGTRRWLESALALKPAIVFGQEFTDYGTLKRHAVVAGYQLCTSRTLGSGTVGSWLLVRLDIQVKPLYSVHSDVTDFFGPYVAGARLACEAFEDVTVLSVHASPRAVPSSDLARWPGLAPAGRLEAEGMLRELYFSDLVLAMVIEVNKVTPTLVAGDLNEARSRALSWRARLGERHRFGEQLFERIAAADLVDVTFRGSSQMRV